MHRAFIFDMDGVLIDSESVWQSFEKPMLLRLLGKEIAEGIGSTIGLNMFHVFKEAQALGSTVSLQDLRGAYEKLDPIVYERVEITPGVDALIQALRVHGFKIGLVTQTSENIIDRVLAKLSPESIMDATLSLYLHPELKSKPSPDGYQWMLEKINADPKRSFVLEDSNPGIQSGKAAGTFVIGYRGNLLDGYEQTGADAYADTMEEVAQIVASH